MPSPRPCPTHRSSWSPTASGTSTCSRSRASTTRWSSSRSTAARRWSGVGGGVLGDVSGFAAATYLRGIDIVHVPTTLLAQVDSAIGGKVGVNHPLGKNLIGAFHQPRLVVIDPLLVATLPRREFRAGLYEVVKYGMTSSRSLFDRVGRSVKDLFKRDPDALQPVIAESCAIKADVVARDERESGPRRVLNFGHTAGHAIEAITRYKRFRHGEAVGYGMLVAAEVGVGRGRLAASDRDALTRPDPAARPAAVDRRSGDCRDGRGNAPRQKGRRWPATLRAVHRHRRTRGGRRCDGRGAGRGPGAAWAFEATRAKSAIVNRQSSILRSLIFCSSVL